MARFDRKCITAQELAQKAASGDVKRPLIFTNGVFDILHRGHVSYLDQAAQMGATLVVGVNTDSSVKRLGKGDARPYNSLEDRMAMLAALESVDWVVAFDKDTPEALIALLKPDVIVKGGDYNMAVLPETKLVESWGGKAVAIDFEHERSTTALVKRIQESAERERAAGLVAQR